MELEHTVPCVTLKTAVADKKRLSCGFTAKKSAKCQSASLGLDANIANMTWTSNIQ